MGEKKSQKILWTSFMDDPFAEMRMRLPHVLDSVRPFIMLATPRHEITLLLLLLPLAPPFQIQILISAKTSGNGAERSFFTLRALT